MNTVKFGKLSVVAASVLVLAACGDKTTSTPEHDTSVNQLVQTRDSLQQVVADQDSLLSLLNELGDGMQQIKTLENILSSV